MADVLAFVLIIGLLNFVLGYALALALADPPFHGLGTRDFWSSLRAAVWSTRESPAAEADSGGTAPQAPSVNLATANELPDAWLQALRQDAVHAELLADGIAYYVQLGVGLYREQLLTAEDRARLAQAAANPVVYEQLGADLKYINLDWAGKLASAAELLAGARGRLGPAEKAANFLEETLFDQAAQISLLDREIHDVDYRADITLGGRRLSESLHALLRLAHELRDGSAGALASILAAQDKLGKLDARFQLDAATGLMNRMGTHFLLHAPTAAQGQAARPIAAMLVKAEHFGRVNERVGTRGGDEVLKSHSRLLIELAMRSKGTHIAAHYAGVEFLILSHEERAEDLALLGEQIRQCFEAATFSHQGAELTLALSVAVAEIGSGDTLDNIEAKLRAAQVKARKAGRNRTVRWDPAGPLVTPPPAIPIQSRLVVVETAAAA